jgi:threonine dehydratase
MSQHPVYDIASVTPLEKAMQITADIGFATYLKREDLQPVHSFKLRGAYNKIYRLSEAERRRGIIAASAGNHAQGVALAAKKLGLSAIIVMPKTAPLIKVRAVESYGATVELYGDNFSEAYEYSQKRTVETGRTFIHPFDDPLVIEGQGTIGLEILKQLPEVTHVFVPIGGGGLIAGVAQSMKKLKPNVKIIGVEPHDSAAMKKSLQANKRIALKHVGIFSDGVAVKQVGENTFSLTKQYVDDCITVSTDQICSAIKSIYEETRTIVEGAGALGLAGVKTYAKHHDLTSAHVVAICSGANLSFERLQFVAERTLLGSGSESLFAVDLPEKPGALLKFCEQIVNGYNITEFNYRIHSRSKARILVGIGSLNGTNRAQITKKLNQYGYDFVDLSRDEIAKEHIRHMVGGAPGINIEERIYSVDFPERPGALGDFLATVSSSGTNISLFHYRGQGADVGKVLIGLEGNPEHIKKVLKKTGYSHTKADKNIKLFL